MERLLLWGMVFINFFLPNVPLHSSGTALIRVNMAGPDSQRYSSTPLLVANLKECLPGFMCVSQQNLTRNDNLTGIKNPTNSLEAWKGPREIIVFLMTHDGRPLKLLECGVLKLFQQQVLLHFKCASEYTEIKSSIKPPLSNKPSLSNKRPPLFQSKKVNKQQSSPLFKPPPLSLIILH